MLSIDKLLGLNFIHLNKFYSSFCLKIFQNIKYIIILIHIIKIDCVNQFLAYFLKQNKKA